jgi:hypothetical protein
MSKGPDETAGKFTIRRHRIGGKAMTATTQMVPVMDLVNAIGPGAEQRALYLIEKVNGKIDTDWFGSPVIPATTAQKAIELHRAEIEDNADRQSRYAAYVAEREREREGVGSEAYRKAAEKIHAAELRAAEAKHTYLGYTSISANPRRGPVWSPAARRAGWEARREAYERFDKRNPLRPLEDFE